MPMLDIQKRHAEMFRIRLGEKGPKGEPRKLTDAIRVTSPIRSVVDAFVATYGGQTDPWVAPDGPQYQAKLPVTELSIMVLPGQSFTQWWELYRGSVCERRCDGFTEHLSAKPCMCPSDLSERMAAKAGTACRPTTRVNVVCPDVDVVGAGGLVTHGIVAAETLPQSIAIAEAALARGLMVPAVLRVVEHKGKRHFIVPQIEIVGVNLNALATGEVREVAPAPPRAVAAPEQPAITAAPAASKPRATKPKVVKPTAPPPPLPNELPGRAGDVAELAALKEAVRKLPEHIRAKCREELAAKNLHTGPGIIAAGPNGLTETKEIVRLYEQEAIAYLARAKKVVLACKEAGLESDEERHALIAHVTGGEKSSTKELADGEAAAVIRNAKLIGEELSVAYELDGTVRIVAREAV